MDPVLELTNATLIRGRTRVFENLSMRVGIGQHTAVLGPNGAGKSSFIRMLTLDDRPRSTDNGVAPLRIFGRASWDLSELRTRMGVVTGDLDAGFGLGTSGGRVRGLDVALSGLLGSHGVFAHHDVTVDMRARARDALARVEAEHLAAKPLNEMSTGERRRGLIARALITTPDALVLDEPTTGLDLVARHRFMERVRHVAREHTTVMLVTQHIDEIFPEIRRVIVLREGRVIDDGPKDQVLRGSALPLAFGGPIRVTCEDGYYYARP